MVLFEEVKVNIVATEGEKVGLDALLLARSEEVGLPSDMDGLEMALERLVDSIHAAKDYVDRVVVRGVPPCHRTV